MIPSDDDLDSGVSDQGDPEKAAIESVGLLSDRAPRSDERMEAAAA